MTTLPKISIIIPVYNVEKYIEQCVRSLFEQTLKDIEFIFVDDCSQDNSITIVNQLMECYPHRKHQVKIIRHEVNKKLGSVRATGVRHAQGEYIAHCDSDDFIEKNMYEQMLSTAISGDYDMVWCDIMLCDHNGKDMKRVSQNLKNSNDPIKELLMCNIWPNVWNRLIKKSLFKEENLQLIEGAQWGEDLLQTCALFVEVKSFSHIPASFYHYRQINTSLMASINKSNIDSLVTTYQKLYDYLYTHTKDNYSKEINAKKIQAKFGILRRTDNRKLYYNLYPELKPRFYKSKPDWFLFTIAIWCIQHKMYFIGDFYFGFLKKILGKMRK